MHCCCRTDGGEWAARSMKNGSQSTWTASPTSYWKMLPQQGTLRCLYGKTKSHMHAHTCAHILTWTQNTCEYTNTYMHGLEVTPVCTDNICTHVPAHISTHRVSGLLPAGVSAVRKSLSEHPLHHPQPRARGALSMLGARLLMVAKSSV